MLAPKSRFRRKPLSRRTVVLAAVAVLVVIGVIVVLVLRGATSGGGLCSGPSGCADEFDGPAGSAPDQAAWTTVEGGGGWGNNELQEYSGSAVYLDGDSHLVVEARRATDAGGNTTWTSGRVTTQGKASFSSGTLSARIKLPDGAGLLPAFWLLGDSVAQVGWPASGEIDVVETPGDTSTSYSNIHGPSNGSPFEQVTVNASSVHPDPLSDAFHVYSLERSPGHIIIRMDDEVLAAVDEDTAPTDLDWVFDQPFHVLFSLAVGGDWPGDPDESTPAVSRMLVDWIRYTPLSTE